MCKEGGGKSGASMGVKGRDGRGFGEWRQGVAGRGGMAGVKNLFGGLGVASDLMSSLDGAELVKPADVQGD